MLAIFYIFVFILGLIIGSFLNCIIFRIEKGETFLKGRSKCMHCGHILSWKDLAPVFSFLFLAGKCRYCRQKISIQYPLVEVLTGALFIFIFWKFGSGFISGFEILDFLNLIYFWTIASIFIIIFVYDLRHYLIPDGAVFMGIGLTLIYNLFLIFSSAEVLVKVEKLGFSIFPALFFLILFLISRGKWIGFGDIKLAVFMGLFLGFPEVVIALFFGVFIGAIIGLVLILLNKKKPSSEIPFGPFLTIGTFIALFWGNQIINWYLSLIA